MSPTIEITPSLLACDFARLADEIKRLEVAGASGWHVDVMDGHFVPNITMGPSIVQAVRRSTTMPIDVHLMVYNPYSFIEAFIAAGADRITFHVEATEDIDETIQFIHSCGKKAGLAISPQTPIELLEPFLGKIDLALIMTVNPGFGGQSFIEHCLDKVSYLHDIRHKYQLRQATDADKLIQIQVDGGIDAIWGPACIKAGADSLVSGTYLFRSEDPKNAIARLNQ